MIVAGLLIGASEASAQKAPRASTKVSKAKASKTKVSKTKLRATKPGTRVRRASQRVVRTKLVKATPRVVKTRAIKATTSKTNSTKAGKGSKLEAFRKFVLSGSPKTLAGGSDALLRGAKIKELLHAAKSGKLTDVDIATFAQSVHPKLLEVFEKGAKLPAGFFLSTTRAVQFAGGNPFNSDVAPTAKEKKQLQKSITDHLVKMVTAFRQRGGTGLPNAVQLLTGTSHLIRPESAAGDAKAVRAAVEAIPHSELVQRNKLITGMSAKQILAQTDSRTRVPKDLVNFDHLLGALGKNHKGRLLIEIYAENMPTKGTVARYLPVTALGEGSYCVDDIARTTVAVLQSVQGQKSSAAMKNTAKAGLRFVEMMQARNGEYYNFASLKNGKLSVNKNGTTSQKGIDFWAARAVWAMGEGYSTFAKSDPKMAEGLARSINRTLPQLERRLGDYGKMQTVDGHQMPKWLINNSANVTSIMLKGLLPYHQALKPGKTKDRVAALIEKYADGLAKAQVTDKSAKDYGRHYSSVTDLKDTHLWGSRQVDVLAGAYQQLGKKSHLASAELGASYFARGKPKSMVTKGEEEIAYGIEPVVAGFARLHKVTGKAQYAKQTYNWSSWLLGNNSAKALIYEPSSGRGYDGIRHIETGTKRHYSVNTNSGAESTVEAILTLQAAAVVPGVSAKLRKLLANNLPK